MIIRGKKVLLRPITKSNFPLFQKWFTDLEVMQYVISRMPLNIRYTKEMWVKEFFEEDRTVFIIEIIENKKPIGICGFKKINHEDRDAVFGITIGEKNCWNSGYGTEASQLLINYGFKELNLSCIYSSSFGFNDRSKRMHKKLGFKEKIKENDCYQKKAYRNGKYWDNTFFSLFKKEWEEKQKEF